MSRGHFQTKIATNFINNNHTPTLLSRKRESTLSVVRGTKSSERHEGQMGVKEKM